VVFALGTSEEMADSVRESERGIVVRHDDELQIEACLLNLCGQFFETSKRRIVSMNREFVRQFEWRNLTIRLEQVLNSVVSTDS
jgi:hypothetical protein